MERKIIRLPEALINKIAAGEVVENSASIVKELVENSLDAGARRIQIEIQGGGKTLIKVEDDGFGMGPEDAALCIERHATSKIKGEEDLESILTMGFRGEALAAIAAVSQFEIKTADGVKGTRVLGEGGLITTLEPCARNRGTTVEIRSLFFNVPARKKFQKSNGANTSQAIRVVETLSLAHPEIAFLMKVDGKKSLDVGAGETHKERIESLLGKHDHEVLFEKGEARIHGLLASVEKASGNRSGQHLFVNRRPIFSPFIARAVKMGFGTRLAEHAFPAFVLFLEIAPDLVDINVHPQKKEARFQDEGKIFRLFEEAVVSSFEKGKSFGESLTFTPPVLSPFSSFERSAPHFEEERSFHFEFQNERPLVVFGNYLAVMREESLLLVDLQAAHARALYDSFTEKRAEAQALIWPLEIELSFDLDGEKVADELKELGIESRFLGKKMLVVDALPPFLDAASFTQFFQSWKEGKKLSALTSRFCKSLKKSYSLDEAFFLL